LLLFTIACSLKAAWVYFFIFDQTIQVSTYLHLRVG
jgi:hypothetical protein